MLRSRCVTLLPLLFVVFAALLLLFVVVVVVVVVVVTVFIRFIYVVFTIRCLLRFRCSFYGPLRLFVVTLLFVRLFPFVALLLYVRFTLLFDCCLICFTVAVVPLFFVVCVVTFLVTFRLLLPVTLFDYLLFVHYVFVLFVGGCVCSFGPVVVVGCCVDVAFVRVVVRCLRLL
jgi:hypothetical protein